MNSTSLFSFLSYMLGWIGKTLKLDEILYGTAAKKINMTKLNYHKSQNDFLEKYI